MAKETGLSQTNIRYWLGKYGLKSKVTKSDGGKNHIAPVVKFECKKCQETNPGNFYKTRNRCKKCHNLDQTTRFRQYKKQAVEYKGGCCQRSIGGKMCGYNRCLAGLDFHHLDPKQKDPKWRAMKNWKFDRIKKELDKCILVCKNCHAEIHHVDIPQLDARKNKKQFDVCPICGNEKYIKLKYCSLECFYEGIKKFNIIKEELERLIQEKPYEEIGKMFGVTGNAIKKRCRAMGIKLENRRGYWAKKRARG